MAGTVKEANLTTRTARLRLKRGRQPHWTTIRAGREHLGYQRAPASPEGRWLARRYADGRYSVETLGRADDREAADGQRVLSYEQALAKAGAGERRPSRYTVRDAAVAYIEYLEAHGKPIADAEGRIAAHILPRLGDVPVAELTSAMIRRWLADLASSPALKRTRKGVAQTYREHDNNDEEAVRRRRSSANRCLNIVKAVLNHAHHEGKVSSAEAWGRKVRSFRGVDAARVRFLSVEECQRLIHASDPNFRELVVAALQTGARFSELTRLRCADFSTAGTIWIQRSKAGKERHIILSAEGTAFFSSLVVGRAGDEPLFRRRWNATAQRRELRAALARTKIEPITFHGLRHSWASLAIMNNVPAAVVAQNLGHADTRMVEKFYGHLSHNFAVEAVRAGAPRFLEVDPSNIKPIRTRRF